MHADNFWNFKVIHSRADVYSDNPTTYKFIVLKMDSILDHSTVIHMVTGCHFPYKFYTTID